MHNQQAFLSVDFGGIEYFTEHQPLTKLNMFSAKTTVQLEQTSTVSTTIAMATTANSNLPGFLEGPISLVDF